MDISENAKMSTEEMTSLLKLVEDYLTTRKGLVYIVHYAFAESQEGEALLRMPNNSIVCTGDIKQAVASFFMMTTVARKLADAKYQEEITTAITGEIVSNNLNVEHLYDRTKDEVIPLLVSMLATEKKDAVASVVLQMTRPISPIKDTEEDFITFYEGILN